MLRDHLEYFSDNVGFQKSLVDIDDKNSGIVSLQLDPTDFKQ